MLRTVRGVLRRARSLVTPVPESFLENARGVIHVGANTGQERDFYERYRLPVIWIEPVPEVFDQLKGNLRGYARQRAFRYLVTDADDQEYAFHVSNNDGKSSSILELKLHKDIWPEVAFTKSVMLRSVTLPSLLRREGVDIRNYDTLIMDTQGSELLVLKGAVPILPDLTFVKTEVSDFESYEGCCQLEDVGRFLEQHGFAERERHPFARRAEGGVYYDVTYERTRSQS